MSTAPSQDPVSCQTGVTWTLEDILATERLGQKPARQPDYQTESNALGWLARQMAEDPDGLLQKLVETAMKLCRAGSAGVSLAEKTKDGDVFRWRATAGLLKPFLGGTLPRHFSPCGVTVERGSTQVMVDPVRYYPYVADLKIPIAEVLLVPFFLHGEAVGTVWIVSHDKSTAFDQEDARLVASLAQFAAAASQALSLKSKSATVQHQLQEVQAKLESALEAGSIATWSWDIINNRVFADSHCAHLFSISDEDALGGPIARYIESIHPDDRERVNEAIQSSVNSSGAYEVEYRLLSKGTYRWVIARGKVLRDAAGRPTHFPGVIVDIAERKQAQMDLDERQRALWAGLPVACYTLDAEGKISFYNEAASALWGRKPVLGVDLWCGAHALLSLAGDPIPMDLSPGALAFKERRSIRGLEVHVVRPDGTRRWVAPHADPIYDPSGKFVGLINVLYDMTEERVATAALREARDQAILASRAKDDFLAALSHELRTPLNPVLLLASDAARNTSYPAEIRADFEAIWRNVELEARLIDDLLDITRIARGKLKLDCVLTDLHAVVEEAEKKVRPDAREKNLRMIWDLKAGHSLVYGDPVRLQQVFWNVLKNAVKFTPAGGVIHLSSADSADGREVKFCVRDSGIGIRAEELSGIFDAFTQGSQAEGGAHFFGGLGLGLAISQQVMHLHQGRIVAHSEGEGKGACFAIEMPVVETTGDRHACPGCDADTAGETTKSALVAAEGKPGAGGEAPLWRILIIEDHVPSRQALQRLLNRRKHTVEAAGTGEEACLKMNAGSFDLVICDIGLPDTDGYTLAQELLQIQPEVPLVAMTGYGTENDIRRAEVAGFMCHLTKPVSAARLEHMLAKVNNASVAAGPATGG